LFAPQCELLRRKKGRMATNQAIGPEVKCMLGLETQLALAKSWNDAAMQWMAAWNGLTADMMWRAIKPHAPAQAKQAVDPSPSQGSPSTFFRMRERQSRSWYKPPIANPFAISMFGLFSSPPLAGLWPTSTPLAAFAAWGAYSQPYQFWTAMLGFARFALNPVFPAGSLPNWANWPQQPQSWYSIAPSPVVPDPAPQAPFVAYRSDSGHAVTQIRFPNNVVAAIAVPPAATNGLGTWSSLWTA
jgi:hypothetical protein